MNDISLVKTNADIALEQDNFGYANVAEALDDAEQVGNDVVFDFGAGGMLTVESTTIGQLQNDLDLV